MDRFIGVELPPMELCLFTLKSNMDRFIVCFSCVSAFADTSLKSNMDRFIGDSTTLIYFVELLFKIQYGQIYRCSLFHFRRFEKTLKSNMDRFIDQNQEYLNQKEKALKSNMDRFIA